MVQLVAEDVFQVFKNAQDAGLLDLWPGFQAEMGPGKRFFESLQRKLLDRFDIDKLDQVLYYLAPTIQYMAEPSRWEPKDFTAEEMFQAVKNLQTMGVFEIAKEHLSLPGAGDRFFEYYQNILVNKIGVDTLDRILFSMGQCICYLATDDALQNMEAVDWKFSQNDSFTKDSESTWKQKGEIVS